MKKLLLLTGLLTLFSSITFAKHVDENTAKKAGQNFITSSTNSQILKSSTDLQLVYTLSSKANVAKNMPQITFFYVFNAGVNGFVIVAGDDNVTPILGYSDEVAFDPNNVNRSVQKWLEGYKNQIRYVVTNNIDATDEIKEEWEKLLSEKQNNNTEKASVPPLVQTKWNQSPHENALCPYDNSYNERTVTGCPATAMAQIMKYWNYPTHGTGFHSYNHSTYGTLSANFGSTTYQWNSMPNTLTGSNNAVSTLMYHCGVAVEMNYGVAATGGSSSYVIIAASPSAQQACENAFKTYFGYNASTIQGLRRSNYSNVDWINLLKNELNQSRPIQYAGFGSGGHTWVCDGYDNNNLFHMNWGWGGYQDGYFQLNALNPGAGGIGGAGYSYNNDQQALIGIQPPSGNVNPQNFNLQLYSNITMPSQVWFTSPFSLTVDIINTGTNTFTGQYGAAIFDNNNNFVNFMEVKPNETLNSNYHYPSGITFSTAGSPAYVPGMYKVALFYKTSTQDWTVIGNGNYSNLQEFEIYYSSAIETNSAFTITTNGGKLIKGSNATVNVDVINTASSTYFGDYRVNLANLDGTWAQNIQIVGENNGLQSNYHYINGLDFSGEITVEPGTYLMEIAYQQQGTSNWYYAGSSNFSNPVYVIVEAPGLSPDQYEINNTVAQAYTLPISFLGSTATKNTVGSNIHVGTDYDFYKINLPVGYDYVITGRIHDSYNSGNGNTYTGDVLVLYSTDGTNWSEAYDDVIDEEIVVLNGGTVYFHVAPYFSGEVGSYLLDIEILRDEAVVSINESNLSDLISVYPNPASDFVTINLNKFSDQVDVINVLNVQGKQISSTKIMAGGNTIQLPLEGLSDGVYFIQVHSTQGMLTKKIIIRK